MWRDSESNQDFLNFTELADQIAMLATSPSLLPVSIGVFGTWGTGKSTVLRLVERKLESADPGPIIITFDAWLYQGYDDSKAALMEVVADRLFAEAAGNQTIVEKVHNFAARINYFRALGMAADVGVGMALGVPPGLMTRAGSALGALMSGQFNAQVAADSVQAAKDGGIAAANVWSQFVRPEEARTPPKEIQAFRQEFGDILTSLERPLVLFIDNLDRCLPDVAIGTLEAIRLFLFIEGTAFVIAADEDMVRHSVAKHFSDPNAQHVRDYLDKVIQVPMRVPQVGPADLRAYMYSLFVGLYAPAKLECVQKRLLNALQESWKGADFTRDDINDLAGKPEGLLDALAVSDRLAPILAAAPTIGGNPRIVKRLLNAITLRKTLAADRGMNVSLATLAKLAVFERSTDGTAAQKLYQLVMEDADATAHLAPDHHLKEAERPSLPTEWKNFQPFIDEWREMEPYFIDTRALRPAVFLSRDVMAPARNRAGMTEAARNALDALIAVTSVNSPAAKPIVEALSPTDCKVVMDALVTHLREQDLSKKPKGLHGALILSSSSTEASEIFKAFVSTLRPGSLYASSRALLQTKGFLGKGD